MCSSLLLSQLWKVPNTYTVKGLLRKGPVANSGGSGTKRGRNSSGAPFYNGHHVTPRGYCSSLKQDHQFLNKISTLKIAVNFISVVFSSPFFHWCLSVELLLWLYVYLKSKLIIFVRYHTCPSCLLSRKHQSLMTLRSVI